MMQRSLLAGGNDKAFTSAVHPRLFFDEREFLKLQLCTIFCRTMSYILYGVFLRDTKTPSKERPHIHIIPTWLSDNNFRFRCISQNLSPFARREFFREIFYKNIAIIAIQHGNVILLTPLAIFPILLGEIHSSPSGKFPYTY